MRLVAHRTSSWSNAGQGAVRYCSVLHATCTEQSRTAELAAARGRSTSEVLKGVGKQRGEVWPGVAAAGCGGAGRSG